MSQHCATKTPLYLLETLSKNGHLYGIHIARQVTSNDVRTNFLTFTVSEIMQNKNVLKSQIIALE
jgi:hypothetical protein